MLSKKISNEVYSSLSAVRRYEVWFVRLALADGSGAWWFRYLLMNPGRQPLPLKLLMPVQVWATWFPLNARPETIIQGYSLADLDLSARSQHPFRFFVRDNEITENSCRGSLAGHGHNLSWELNYRSTFSVTLSDKGWIGFSRTSHSDAIFSGRITLDGHTVEGDPLGYGLQGHNCGYKHRGFWVWTHASFPRSHGTASTLEALLYDMPLRLLFRKAVLWHEGRSVIFHRLEETSRDTARLCWQFRASRRDGLKLQLCTSSPEVSIHRLPYQRTDGTGSFEVANSSLAHARLRLQFADGSCEELQTSTGAVLEMGGDLPSILR